jgi:hypothetical protein
MHTCPTERPFYCITGDLSGEGLLVVVDTRTHALVVEQGDDETVMVRVNPQGVEVKGPTVRPGTRMLEIPPPAADPLKLAGESVERLQSGAIGAPRAPDHKVLSSDSN